MDVYLAEAKLLNWQCQGDEGILDIFCNHSIFAKHAAVADIHVIIGID